MKEREVDYDNLTTSLLAAYEEVRGKPWEEQKTDIELFLSGLSDNQRAFVGSKLRGAMYRWDKEHHGEGLKPNPYAPIVYAIFSPVGGS